MKRHLVKLCVFVTFFIATAMQAQSAMEDGFVSGGQPRRNLLARPHWSEMRGGGETIGCAPLTGSALFAPAENDCTCSGTPLVSCWVSTDDCPAGFHGECYESSTF